MTTELPQLPASLGSSPSALVLAINDRLRRITDALNGVSKGTPGATGRPGPPGSSGGGLIFYGTHANRLATAVPADASLYVETDRGNLVYQVQATIWTYVRGTYPILLAAFTGLAATLGLADTGLLAEVTDFAAHTMRWTGTGWTYADPGDPAGRIEAFLIDPPAVGWQLCDGTAGVIYMLHDGSTATVTVPDLVTNPAYLKFGAAAAAIAPPTAPGLSGATAAAVTGITTTGNDVGTPQTALLSGVGSSIPAEPHTHGIGDPGHSHLKGSLMVDATAQPQNIVLRAWFRK